MFDLYIFVSVEPSWEEIEDELVGIIDHVVLQSGDIVRVDHGKIEPSRATLPHITLNDEIVVVAKDIIKQVHNSFYTICLLIDLSSLLPL